MADAGSSGMTHISQVQLPEPVDELLKRIYSEQSLQPIKPETRLLLASAGGDVSILTLRKVANLKVLVSLDGLIKRILENNIASPNSTVSCSPIRNESPITTPTRPITATQVARGTSYSPQMMALGELEYLKAFLLLSYIGDKCLEEVNITSDEIRQLKDLSMEKFEAELWNKLGHHYIKQEERRKSLVQDQGKTYYYHCHVGQDGNCEFKGPYPDKTTTHLHRVLGDDNVLLVKFAELTGKKRSVTIRDYYARYKRIAQEGILVGLRRYHFFVFKDSGKEGKKKDPTSMGIKCYFVRMESHASIDEGQSYALAGKTIHEARLIFMHVHTLPSVATYMARFYLILSKTTKLDVDLADVNVEEINDIICKDENGIDVSDKDGKPHIHSDGTGFISHDLASKWLKNSTHESKRKIPEPEGLESQHQEPPLLIQFRLFNNGCAVKGTLLVNYKLPHKTIQVRPSMIKVRTDPSLSSASTENSLEVVGTSHKPRRTYLSRMLIALLSYGGVPDEFFLNLMSNALDEAQCASCDKRAALRAFIIHGEMDDFNATRMILSGIPLDECYLQYHLSILLRTEKNNLKGGKLPVPECYYLMGTVDPTGVLEADEVCIILGAGQISGKVLVYRNPGLHFGDIHILKATYVESLEDIVGNAKYGIFFPQKGPRSLGDEIAGGDFDGDMYFVSRNPELLEYYKGSEPWTSASSTPKEPSRSPSDFTDKALEDELFRLFLKTRFQPSYTIGAASDSWLAIMDRLLVLGDNCINEKTAMRKKLLQLIDIYYDALDAPKKGGKVELPLELKAKRFPHYMGKNSSFRSTSILGLIFDEVSSYEDENPKTIEVKKMVCFDDNEVPEHYKAKWRDLYREYKQEMRNACNLVGEDRNEAAEEVVRQYKKKLYGGAEFEESQRSLTEIYQEALAIYNVVYDYAMLNDVGKCGFAWKVAGAALCKLYADKVGERTLVCIPSVLKEVFGIFNSME